MASVTDNKNIAAILGIPTNAEQAKEFVDEFLAGASSEEQCNKAIKELANDDNEFIAAEARKSLK